MDIRCKFCDEPWDVDELHGVVECFKRDDIKFFTVGDMFHPKVDFDTVREWFYKFGCAAFDKGWDGIVPTEQGCVDVDELTEKQKTKGAAIEMLQDLLGDDIDGVAAMTEDFEYMGMM